MTSEAARSKAPEAVAGRRPGRCQVRPELRAQLRGRLTVPALRWPRCTVSAQLRRDRRVPIEVLLAGACQQRAPRTNISHGLDRRRCVLRLAHLAAHPRTCQAGCHRGRASSEIRSADAASARRLRRRWAPLSTTSRNDGGARTADADLQDYRTHPRTDNPDRDEDCETRQKSESPRPASHLARPQPARASRPRGSRACRRPCCTTSSAGRASFGSAPSPARAAAPTRRCMYHRSRRSCLQGPRIESALGKRRRMPSEDPRQHACGERALSLGPEGGPGLADGPLGRWVAAASQARHLERAGLPRMSCSESARISRSSTWRG